MRSGGLCHHVVQRELQLGEAVVVCVDRTLKPVGLVFGQEDVIAVGQRSHKREAALDITGQRLVLFDDDGTTELRAWALATDGGEGVATATGVQTRRGVPT